MRGYCWHATGDAIPTTALWQYDTTDVGCVAVGGAELFYSMQRGSPICPTAYCSLTGLNEPNTVVMYFVRDAAGALSLVIHADASVSSNTDGGALKVLLTADDIPNTGVELIHFDDLGAKNFSDGSWFGSCANVARDCHSWDTLISRGYFGWTWVSSEYRLTAKPIFRVGVARRANA